MNFKYKIVFALLIVLTSCAKDNYDEPGSFLKGNIVYNGEPINVEYNQVAFQLLEAGFVGVKPIDVNVAQDGSFSQLLFNGDFTLAFRPNQGPFVAPYTESEPYQLKLNGSQNLDIEVTPFYMIRNPQFSMSNQVLTSTFALEKIITNENAKDVERVSLYVNETQFVSGASNIKIADLGGGDIVDQNNITLSLEVPSVSQTYVFARVGVKIAGVEDMLFSPVQKITIQ
ncbi:MAG TPA: DUF3823 domain-containing protein [Cytophagales bacterium]|nr:DUF3823 domain-containing protein [Cytophagales bacterium]